MGYRGYARNIPEDKDYTCSNCTLVVEIGDGRRYRMKWRHFHCLPETRLKQICGGEDEAARTREKYGEATKILEEETQ